MAERVEDDRDVLLARVEESERRAERAERQLQRLEGIVANITDAFFALDRAWRFTFVNDRAEQLLRRPRAELLGRDIWAEFGAAVGTAFEREYRRAMRTGTAVAFEAHYPPLAAWFGVNAYPGPDGLTVYFRDVTARRRTDEALRVSEARFRALAEGGPHVVWTAAADGRLTYMSPRARDVTGLPPDAMLGEQWIDAVHPDDRDPSVEAWRRSVELGQPHSLEHRLRTADGSYRWSLALAAPVRSEEGAVVGWVGTETDVHDRHVAEAALRDREMRLRSVAESGVIGLYYWRLDGTVTEANDAFLEMIGYSRDDLAAGRVDWRRLTPREYDAVDAEREREIRGTGRHRSYEKEYVAKDGRHVPVLVFGAMLHAESDEGVCLVADYSELRRAEAAALASAERAVRLQRVTAEVSAARTPAEVTEVVVAHAVAAFGAFGGSLALVEPDGGHARFVHAIGYPQAEIDAWRVFPIALDTPFGDAIRGRAAVVLESLDDWGVRYPSLLASARATGNVALVSLPLLVGGAAVGVLGVGFPEPRRVSDDELAYLQTLAGVAGQAIERSRAYEAARAAQRAAEEANRVKAEFLAQMSHELRTPLNAIGGHTQLVELGVYGPVTPGQQDALARVQTSQRHLLGLVSDLLEFARVEAGRVTYRLRAVPLDPLLAEVEALVQPLARTAGITLAREPVADGVAVRADPERLRQILLNLLTNAIKFTDAGGRVAIAGGAADDAVRIAVRDTGRGIAADQLERVFDAFVQVERRHGDAAQRGVGLGLTISRELARAMDGDLTVESEVGVGSTFEVRLPRA